jgi:O-phosphoseryl-tRNA synthetase
MKKLPIKKILAQAKSDYEKAWLDSKKYLAMEGHLFDLKPHGKSHPLRDMIEQSRDAMIKLGFEELVLPMFVEEEDVYREYGPEAALILDRLYYLAELPRPDIGVSQAKINQIGEIVPDFSNIKGLQAIFRRYKKGEIEADDLIEVMVEELKLEEHHSTAIIDKVFPEFKALTPLATKKTLRSHTTALWFLVLEKMVQKKPLPLQYFIVGPKFRREQKQDSTHLFVSNTLSIVIAADAISLEDGKRIGKEIAESIGFKKVEVNTKLATSKYYAPQTEFEIFVQHPITKEMIEIGDGGFYSPVSLAKFGIDVPVVNIGFGCERITMIQTEEVDIRKLVYPYFYEQMSFTDEELNSYLFYKEQPSTEKGKEIFGIIKDKVLENKDAKGPTELNAWTGQINSRDVSIIFYESDEGASLLGKAALNEIWIKDGKIKSVSQGSLLEGGLKTKIAYLDGIIKMAITKAESFSEMDKSLGVQEEEIRIRFVKRPSEINFDMDEKIRDFINSRNKKMDIKGPVFVGVRIIVK